ncbi:hypothetical protein BDW68DRAFT_192829 [Aspergillus falconensis]
MLPIYFLPLVFQFAQDESALTSGVHLLPFVLVLVFAVMLNGALMAQFGYYMPWYLLGSVLALASFPVAQVKAPTSQLFQSVAFIGVGQVGGIALALSISNTIFVNRATSRIAQILPGQERREIQQAMSGVRATFFTELTEDQAGRVIEMIIGSINDVFIMMVAAAAFSVILAAFLRTESLFVKQDCVFACA